MITSYHQFSVVLQSIDEHSTVYLFLPTVCFCCKSLFGGGFYVPLKVELLQFGLRYGILILCGNALYCNIISGCIVKITLKLLGVQNLYTRA